MVLSLNFVNQNKNQNCYSNPYPKTKFFISNYLIRNLEICKIPKPEYQKNLKPVPNTLGFLGAYVCTEKNFNIRLKQENFLKAMENKLLKLL